MQKEDLFFLLNGFQQQTNHTIFEIINGKKKLKKKKTSVESRMDCVFHFAIVFNHINRIVD